MSLFSDRLRALRIESHTTQERLADDLGVAKSLISMYENGKRLPSYEMLENIADYFNISMASLVGQEMESFPDMLPVVSRRVPILGGAACGEPIYEPGDGTEYIGLDGDAPCDFALIAHGDSMTGDRIYEGDVVFFRSQSDVRDGEIAAVAVDDSVTIKRVLRVRGADGMVVFTQLLSSNPKFAPILIGGEGETRCVRIMGKAIALKALLNR